MAHFVSMAMASIWLATAAAAPSPNYPFNDQLPPVARYGQAYTYQLPSDTFVTGAGATGGVNYTLANQPQWLQFDATSRTLSGTPPQSDSSQGDQTVQFVLTGQDSTGTANSTCQLQISSAQTPQLSTTVASEALNKAGPTASDNSVVLQPNQPFSVQFPNSVFDNSDGRKLLGYFALSDDHSPLPIWLDFDQSSLTLSGTAPSINSQIAPEQAFGIALIMSDYSGFASAQFDFHLLVGAHQLSINFSQPQSVNTTVGKSFQYEVPLTEIVLDSKPLQMSNVSSISINNTDSSDWLTLDPHAGIISGTPPKNASDQDLTLQVTVNDMFQDTVVYNLQIAVQSQNESIFSSSSLNPANSTVGEWFQYSLAPFLLDKSATVQAVSNPEESWLTFHQQNNTLNGLVPTSFNHTTVTFSATDGSTTQQSTLFINGVKKAVAHKPTKSSSSSTPSATSSTPSATSSAPAAAVSKGVSTKTIAILCGVLIPCCILLAALLLFCCLRRKRSYATAPSPNSPGGKQISAPILPDDPEKMDPSVYPTESIGSGTTAHNTIYQTPDNAKDKMPDPNMPPYANNDWEDSPQRASTFNFLRLDGGIEDEYDHNAAGDISDHTLNSEESHAGVGRAITVPDAVAVTDAGRFNQPTAEQLAAEQADTVSTGKPRNSWRQTTGSDKRWQEHQSLGSLATISTDELLTLRLVDRESYASSKERDSYMDPTKSMILTPRHSVMPSDGSSAILKPVGSHSSTVQSHSVNSSVSGTSPQQHGIPPVPSLQSLQEESVAGPQVKPFYRADPESLSNTDYRTASSGESEGSVDELDFGAHDFEEAEEHLSSGSEIIRPYRNSRGELTWNQVNPHTSADFASSDDSDGADDENDDPTQTPRRQSVVRRDSRRETGKLVSQSGPHGMSTGESYSAELAFL